MQESGVMKGGTAAAAVRRYDVTTHLVTWALQMQGRCYSRHVHKLHSYTQSLIAGAG